MATTEPEPEVEVEVRVVDTEYVDKVASFVKLGFDEDAAQRLTDRRVSPSWVRESFLRWGCPHDEVLLILL